ncbi:MAG: leucine-rich repeat domain-containing protein [Promethearchaeota archaeon]
MGKITKKTKNLILILFFLFLFFITILSFFYLSDFFVLISALNTSFGTVLGILLYPDKLRQIFGKKESISSALKTKLKLFSIQTTLKAAKEEPFRLKGPLIPDFKDHNWVFIPEKEYKSILRKMEEGETLILSGKPATGKSVISRYIGYVNKYELKREVFYIDLLRYGGKDKEDIRDALKSVAETINENSVKLKRKSPLLIIENLHDPSLDRQNIGREIIHNCLKTLDGKIYILLTTREDTDDYEWIKTDYKINLDELTQLNQTLFDNILRKFNEKREEKGEVKVTFELRESSPENLWLLGWFLRIVTISKANVISINDLKNNPELLQELIIKYYKAIFKHEIRQLKNKYQKFNEQKLIRCLLIVLLILGITSKYEVFMERRFIVKHASQQINSIIFYELKTRKEIIEDILDFLIQKKEIEPIKFNIKGISGKRDQYRIPHSKLAELLIEYYSESEKKLIFKTIAEKYYKEGMNSNILGQRFWSERNHDDALKCFKLIKKEEKVIKTLLSNLKHFNILAEENHVLNIDLSGFNLELIPQELIHFIKLQRLRLRRNQITEIKNLDNVPNLKELILSENQITEIKNLDNVPDLARLDLDRNQITEIKNLDNVPDLTRLDLMGNQITEIKNLDNVPELTSLNLMGNQITEIKNLDNVPDLTSLNLMGNQITEIKNLDNVPDLASLNLMGNQITEIKNLDNVPDLISLNLIENQITEIKNLDNVPNLKVLYLMGNQITEIKNLDNVPNLKELILSENQITEIKNLDNVPDLTRLNLMGNQITEIKNLDNLPNLKILYLEGNPISDEFFPFFEKI